MTGGRPDVEVVRRHLAALREALANLEAYRTRSAAELRADVNLRWIVERGLQLCTQNALDVATHLSVAAGLDAPDYATAVDLDVVAEVLRDRLPDFAEFAARVERYLDRPAR